jgi:putative transcriptional regulator
MKKEIFLKKLGKQIKKIREKQGMTQTVVANNCNKDAQSIERVENGKINPSAFYLYELSQALNVPLEDFFGFKE